MAPAVVLALAVGVMGCAGTGPAAPEATSVPPGALSVPSEIPVATGSASPSPVSDQALEAARTVVLALAGGDDQADLTGLLGGAATQEVPAELAARAEVNASLLARDGTTMHATVLQGQELTVHADDAGLVLMVYTVSWQASPGQTEPPQALKDAGSGDAAVTAWEVTLTRDSGGWQVADVSTGSGH